MQGHPAARAQARQQHQCPRRWGQVARRGGSARNYPWPALGCLHLPGPSCSGSGTRVVLRGTGLVGPARSLSELTRQIAPPTKNGHAPPPTESRNPEGPRRGLCGWAHQGKVSVALGEEH